MLRLSKVIRASLVSSQPSKCLMQIMYICVYTYICIYIYICIYTIWYNMMCMYVYISLSLYIYIYVHIYKLVGAQDGRRDGREPQEGAGFGMCVILCNYMSFMMILCSTHYTHSVLLSLLLLLSLLRWLQFGSGQMGSALMDVLTIVMIILMMITTNNHDNNYYYYHYY